MTAVVAGGGAYYFAKKSINADRQARFEADQKRREIAKSLEYSSPAVVKAQSSSRRANGNPNGGAPPPDHSGSPSREASIDPAATRHAPESESQRAIEKSKYEASQPYRSKKGDRFS